MEANAAEAALKRSILERAGCVIVLADSSKLGRVAVQSVTDLDAADTLATDSAAPADELDSIRGVPCLIYVAENSSAEGR